MGGEGGREAFIYSGFFFFGGGGEEREETHVIIGFEAVPIHHAKSDLTPLDECQAARNQLQWRHIAVLVHGVQGLRRREGCSHCFSASQQ